MVQQLVGSSSLGLGKLIDGKNQFIHIRYSANANGLNMTTEIQADTKYIGIATNSSETAPTSPSDYSWGRFVGTPGASSYTWIRYSSNADGSNMTTTPNEETKYIGVAITSEDSAPTDYTKYSWALFKGDDGRGIKKTEVSYQKSTSGTVIPTGAWLASIPLLNDGEYLWTRTLFTYTDGTTTSTYNVSRNGTSGLGIARTDVHYQKSTSGTVAPTGTWTVTIPTVRANEYLWTRTTITYTDDSTSVSYSVGKMGADGKDAQLLYLTASSQIQAFDKDNQPKTTQPITISAKLQNASGTATFTAIPYIGNTAQTPITLGGTGNDRTLLPSQWTDPKWTIIAITATLGSLTDTISVNKVKDGESGETPVVHIAWADSADGSEGFTLELPEGKIPKYRGYYVDYSTVASTDPKKYKWERNPDDTGAEVDKAMTAVESAIANAEEAERLAATASQTATIAKQEASAAQNAASMAQGEVSRIEGVIVGVQGDIDTALQEVADQAADLQATKETLELNYAKKTEVSDVQAALTTEISKKVGELQTTVSQTYAAKNDVVSMEGRLQSQITQTAGEVSSVVGKVDKLEADTTEAQKKVDEAMEKSAAAQATANQAQAYADAADRKVTAAQTDLNEAKQNLANTINRVDATEADIAEAQLKVESAQAAVAQAQKDAAEAALAASNAQAAADKAQQDVAALTKRVVSAETAITQNSEQIQLAATRTEEIGDELKNNYYTKEQADAAITVKADSITQTVSQTYATKGNTIKSSVEEFYQSTSPTALSGGSWSTTQPTWAQGKYIWRRTKNTYGNDTVAYTPSVNGVCITGNSGQNGKGVSSYSITYQVGTSGTTAPTGTWTTTIPTVPQGQYLWTKMVITYTDNTSSTSYSVSYIPVNGQAGAAGPAGNGVSSIITEFYLSTSKTTQTGGSWSTTQPTWSPGKYVWTRNKITYTNGSTAYTSPQCSSEWEAVNEIQVGGRNILRGTKDMKLGSGKWADGTWRQSNTGSATGTIKNVALTDFPLANITRGIEITSDSGNCGIAQDNLKLESGEYTLSYYVKAKTANTTVRLQLFLNSNYRYSKNIVLKDTNWTRISATGKLEASQDSMSAGYIFVETPNSTITVAAPFEHHSNKEGAWTPAPEDMATTEEMANLTQTVNTKIEQTSGRIDLVASSVTEVGNKLDNLQVGGRNLIVNSEKYTKDNPWQKTISGRDDWTHTDMYFPVVKNREYTFQFCTNRPIGWHQLDGTAKGTMHIYLYLQTQDMVGTNNNYKRILDLDNSSLVSKNDKYYQTFTIPTDYEYVRAVVRIDGHADGNKYDLRCWNFQAEEGNKDTTWNPPVESMATNSNLQNNYYSKTQTDAAIKVATDSITSTVRTEITTVNNKVDNLQVGSDNLIINGGFPNDTHGWSKSANIAFSVGKHVFYFNGNKNLFSATSTDSNEGFIRSVRFKVKRNTNYTISFIGFAGGNVKSMDVFFLGRKNGETEDYTIAKQPINAWRLSSGSAEFYKATFSTGDSDEGYIRFDHNGSTDGQIAYLFFGEVMLVEGTVAKKYQPSSADIEGEVQQAQNDANEANSKADSNEHRVSLAESTIKQLSDSISMLVTDSNGSSMMTQTSNGWTFNIGAITDAVNSATNSIDDLSGSLSQTNNVVNNLNNLANDLSKKTAYINMTTDETGAPCIELGKTGNAFKVRITNTSVDFIEGSSKIAYVSNQALFIEKAIIKNELQIGGTFGFVWQTRSNGNLGLRYIDPRPVFSAIAKYPQSSIDVYSTKDRYENFNISENPTGCPLGSTIKIKIFNTTTNVYNYIECILIAINSTTQIRIKATGIVTLC